MFELQREILIVNGSSSAFSKNFSCLKTESKTYAVLVNKNQINTINWDQKIEGMTNDQIVAKDPAGDKSNTKSLQVVQVKYCPLVNRSQPVIVVCTTAGALIYEWMGSSVLFFLPLPKGIKENYSYMKGIGFVADSVYIGSCTGEVALLHIKDNSIKQKTSLRDLKSAVVDVENDEDVVVAADMDGTVCAWSHDTKLINKISTGQPINVINTYKKHVFCGTVLGQILVYSIKSGSIVFDISAHARCINTLDIAQEVGYMLSGSEDSFVRVWKIHKGEPMEIECVFSQAVENVPITGGTFVDNRAHSFAITGYDYSTVFYYGRAKSDKRSK